MPKEPDMTKMELIGPAPPFDWRKWSMLGAAIGLPVIFLFWWLLSVNSSASAAFEGLQNRFDDGVIDYDQKTFTRPIVHGDEIEGEAWAHYMDAVQLMGEGGVSEAVKSFVLKWDLQHRDAAAQEADRHPAIRKFLSKGAHCTKVRVPHNWESAVVIKGPSLLQSAGVSAIASASALDGAMKGRTAGAISLLFDTLQFGLDHARGGGMIEMANGLQVLAYPLSVLRYIVMERKLTFSEQILFRKGLSRLREQWPSLTDVAEMTVLSYDRALIASELTPIEGEQSDIDKAAGGFGYGFSSRWPKGEMSEINHRLLERYTHISETSWSERQPELAALEKEGADSGNPLASFLLLPYSGIERRSRKAQAELALLQAAIMIRIEGFQLSKSTDRWPQDPFSGKPVSVEISGDTCRLWSDDVPDFSLTLKKF